MNKLDKDYCNLLQDILENGTKKQTRNGETLSVFGRQIRHSMKDGFPLLTTKKVHFKSIVSELLWFLQGRTDLRWLLEHDNTIWVGDAYKRYIMLPKELTDVISDNEKFNGRNLTQEEFINKIKTDDEFAKKYGELGKVYGVQWRKWQGWIKYKNDDGTTGFGSIWHDQIANLINELKTNPDSRRMIVSAWNVGELDQMVLPPCHYGFQLYTRELSLEERIKQIPYSEKHTIFEEKECIDELRTLNGEELQSFQKYIKEQCDKINIPTRAISLMWNCSNQDVLSDLPSVIASYGLLLEIIAKMVNMVPDELIGNLGDCHIYSNQIEGIKEQIGREFTLPERMELWEQMSDRDVMDFPIGPLTDEQYHDVLDKIGVAKRTREPFPLPKLNINTEWWPTESGECGVGPIDAQAVLRSFSNENFCKCLMEEDIQLSNFRNTI